MTVVADASPLRYIFLIGVEDILPALFGGVLIPRTVVDELSQPGTPETVRRRAAVLPAWAQSRNPAIPLTGSPPNLGAGERDAIALAEELHADMLLIDDHAGRREARLRGIPIQGTLGLLGVAARQGLIDLSIAIGRLRQTNFRASEDLLQTILDRQQERKKRG